MGNAKIQAELWNSAAQDWAKLQEPGHFLLWEAMLNAASVGSGTRILDVGCGGGSASVLAAERNAIISGFDAADQLIEIAQKRVPNGDFRVGDIESLPFEDDAFDVVFAANSVQYPANRLAGIRELKRVCAPNGIIVAGLFGPPEGVAFSTVMKAAGSTLPTPPSGGGPFELSIGRKLEELFEDADLNVVKSDFVDCPFSYPDLETYCRAQLSGGPFQRIMNLVGEEKLRAALIAAAKPFQQADGSYLIGPNIFKFIVATK